MRRYGISVLLAALGTIDAGTAAPLPDGRPEFFAGEWSGTGGEDSFCFIRLQVDGSGTVLASGASGDWFGARIHWRNDRQSLQLVTVEPLAADPHRRLMPLPRLTLASGTNGTLHLGWNGRSSACELQLRSNLARREDEAQSLLKKPSPGRKHDAPR